jgi:sporulation protein YlmC with PRC-barrel domain
MNYEQRDTYGMYKTSNGDKGSDKNGDKNGDKDKGPGPSMRTGPGPELMGAATLIGNSVCNGSSETLGDIKEIMLDMRTGRIGYAVLSFGGFLGMGEKLFAVPWNALTLDTVNKKFVLDVDKARLESAPGFSKDHWPNMADEGWARDIHAYYRTQPITTENARL